MNFKFTTDLTWEGSVVTILRGVPGCGKSTWAKAQPNDLSCDSEPVIVSADNYRLNEHGIYVFERDKTSYCHAQCREEFDSALRDYKTHVIVDNTNISSWEYAYYLQHAETQGYTLRVISFESPPTNRSTHDVPQDKYDAMCAVYSTYVPKMVDAPVVYEIFKAW